MSNKLPKTRYTTQLGRKYKMRRITCNKTWISAGLRECLEWLKIYRGILETPEKTSNHNYKILRALTISIVTNYGKAFKTDKRAGHKEKYPKKILKDHIFSPKNSHLKRVHKTLIRMRDKYVAHSDRATFFQDEKVVFFIATDSKKLREGYCEVELKQINSVNNPQEIAAVESLIEELLKILEKEKVTNGNKLLKRYEKKLTTTMNYDRVIGLKDLQ